MSGPADTPKDERCRLAGCPERGSGNPACAQCSGPVEWTDPRGVRRGRPRACTSCPMDGLGLAVCWAACPGPQNDWATDGQSLVSLGGMPAPDEYLERGMLAEWRRRRDEAASEDGNGRRALDLLAASRLLQLAAPEFDALRDALREDDSRGAAAVLGVPLAAVRGAGSPVRRMMDAIGGDVDGSRWEVLRRAALGDAQARTARLGNVSKQAVSRRLARIAQRHEWVARLVGGLTDGALSGASAREVPALSQKSADTSRKKCADPRKTAEIRENGAEGGHLAEGRGEEARR